MVVACPSKLRYDCAAGHPISTALSSSDASGTLFSTPITRRVVVVGQPGHQHECAGYDQCRGDSGGGPLRAEDGRHPQLPPVPTLRPGSLSLHFPWAAWNFGDFGSI